MPRRRSAGEGSVYQLPNGKWVGAINVADPGEPRKRQTCNGRTSSWPWTARAGHVFWVCHLAELLGHAAGVAGVAPPEVVGVELVNDGLDVLVTGDSPEPLAPFARRPDRPGVWHLPFTTDPGVVDEAATSSPVPLVLATMGQGIVGAVLVNVNHYRSIHITVPADRVEGILSAMATELAGTTSPMGTAAIAVGFGYGVVDRLDGGVVFDDLDEATALMRTDEKAIVLVDPQTTTDELLDVVGGRENVHLVTAGPAAPEGTVLVFDRRALSNWTGVYRTRMHGAGCSHWHRCRALGHRALMLVGGGACRCADIEHLSARVDLLGHVALGSTAHRTEETCPN